MSAKTLFPARTWVEIDTSAAVSNLKILRKIVGSRVKLWTVVKSNAYGHGLYQFAKIACDAGVDGLCIDSLIEGVRLRESGMEQSLLVLGSTLPELLPSAAAQNISVSISTFEDLAALRPLKNIPEFHIKIDTGFHRRGFYLKDVPRVVKEIKKNGSKLGASLRGIFTHFSSAKDINYPTYTDLQFAEFQEAKALFRRAGFKNLIAHAAASSGTLISKKYHEDAVRVGMSSYGVFPSRELEMQLPELSFTPVLSWRTYVSELKEVPKGAYIGYDLTERVHRRTRMAVLPVGYWHGFPRALSSPAGEVLVAGRRAKVLGRVSMDMICVDVTGIACKVGDTVTLVGRDGQEELSAYDVAARANTSPYEILTRLNPLMERRVV